MQLLPVGFLFTVCLDLSFSHSDYSATMQAMKGTHPKGSDGLTEDLCGSNSRTTEQCNPKHAHQTIKSGMT